METMINLNVFAFKMFLKFNLNNFLLRFIQNKLKQPNEQLENKNDLIKKYHSNMCA